MLLTSEVGLEQVSLCLRKTIKAGATLQIHNSEKLHVLLSWLSKVDVDIEKISDPDKRVIWSILHV